MDRIEEIRQRVEERQGKQFFMAEPEAFAWDSVQWLLSEVDRMTSRAEKAEKDLDIYVSAYESICEKNQKTHNLLVKALKETKKQLTESQRREQAAVEHVFQCAENCLHREGCTFIDEMTGRPDCYGCDNFEWRGPQPEEGEEHE